MNYQLLKRFILNKIALWFSYLKLIPILKKLNQDSIVIDCGANVGDITKIFAKTGATVYAFEPDPLAFSTLFKRFEKTKNVTIFQKGVWDRNTKTLLYQHKNKTENELAFTVSSSIIIEKINVDSKFGVEIEVIDLIEFIHQLNKKISVVKLDVEGAETEILSKIIDTKTYLLFDNLYAETHESKIQNQKIQLDFIRKKIREEGIKNIHLNWL